MTYRITRRDGSFIANVNEKALVRGAAPLTLIGRGALDFGVAFNENFIQLLENFAGSSAPIAPMRGMLWYDTTLADLKVMATDGSWKKLAFTANTMPITGGSMTGDLKITNVSNATYSLIGADGAITLSRPDNKTRVNWGSPESLVWAALEQDRNGLKLLGGGNIKIGDHAVWHAGNLNPDLYLLKTGGTITGDLTVTGKLTADVGQFETINVKTLNVTNLAINSGNVWTSTNLNPDLYLLKTGGTIAGSIVVQGTTTMQGAAGANGGLTVNGGQLVATSEIRMQSGPYSAYWHNDGAGRLYLLASNPSAHGGWNDLRPFYANLTNGDVTFGHNVTIGNRLTVDSGRIGAANSSDPTIFLYKPSASMAGGWMINSNNTFSLTTLDGSGGWQAWSKNLLTVDGGGNTTVLGSIHANGDITAFSDERLKTDIRTIDKALDMIGKLRGVRYVRDGAARIGVIAQEVQKVVPEVVHQDTSTDLLSVAYGNLVGLLIEAVKELSAKVAKLEGSE